MGRPRIEILIPSKPFTTRDLKRRNPRLSAFVPQKRLQEWISSGKVRKIGAQPPKGFRKPLYIYEPVDPQMPVVS